jgi:hypothetical protein
MMSAIEKTKQTYSESHELGSLAIAPVIVVIKVVGNRVW